MKRYRMHSMFVVGMLTAVLPFAAASAAAQEDSELSAYKNEMVEFRPVDCGIQAQESYEYPFLGLQFQLPQTLLEKIDSREVFVFTQEDYTPEGTIAYAVLRLSAVTEAQRVQEGMSVDIFSWEEELEKAGAIGVYQKSQADQLDELTGCDVHEKIGTSEDGLYEYYLSTSTASASELTEAWKEMTCSLEEMHLLDLSLGYTAFSEDRLTDLDSVGIFVTEDVFGNAYTQEWFQEYDLTLVNVFATWCSPCVNEMPELEALRKEYEEQDIRLGVVGIVLDTKTQSGIDDGAVERAQVLHERSGVNFPFLIPDETNLNGRLVGIQSVPESFFVNSQGVIVSEPYVGARSKESWKEIVEVEWNAQNEETK